VLDWSTYSRIKARASCPGDRLENSDEEHDPLALGVLSLGLGVGNTYAQGKPLSAHAGVYGSQS
jgi:hypothetical protein